MEMTTSVVVEGTLSELLNQGVSGSVIKLGTHRCNGWCVGPNGLVIRRGNNFFHVTDDGSEKPLGTHEWGGWGVWGVGPNGLVISRGDDFILVVIK